MSSGTSPLLISWSPGSITVIDPASGRRFEGDDLARILGDSYRGRHAVVAIGQRSVFIRKLQVPSLSKDETARLLAIKVGPLVPLDAGEYSFGFRLGAETKSEGRAAVVGAVRTTTLRAIYRDCSDAGLHVQMVVPAAFGSWIAAKSRGLDSCAAISVEGRCLNIDLIDRGELAYSRSIALPPSVDEISDEIACTFEIAQIPPSPVLGLGATVDAVANYSDPKSPVEHLLDPGAGRLLFTLELPEQIEKKSSGSRRNAAERALVALVAAIVVCGLAFHSIAVRSESNRMQARNAQDSYDRAYIAQKTAVERELAARDQKMVLNDAFEPAQTFSDVLHALKSDMGPGVWLTGLTMERGKPIVIRGSAMKQQALTKLTEGISKDHRFRNAKLSFATRTKIGHQMVIQFAIAGAVVGNLPIDEVPKPPGDR